MNQCEEKSPAEDITSIWAIISNLKLDQVPMKYISNLKTEEWDEALWRKATCRRYNFHLSYYIKFKTWSSPNEIYF